MMESNRSTNGVRRIVILFLLGLVFCGVLVAVLWLGSSIPKMATVDFGPPNPELDQLSVMRYSFVLYLNREDYLKPKNIAQLMEREFSIDFGEGIYSISERLQSEGYIRNAEAFRTYLIYSGMDKSVQAGEFYLTPSENIIQISQRLQDATPKFVEFIILPGWRVEEIAALLPSSGFNISEDKFLAAVRQTGNSYNLDVANMEGYLFPGNYQFERDADVEQLLQAFSGKFSENISDEMLAAYKLQGLTLNQAVILASVIEKETVRLEEARLIASVFHNRLRQGMRLESDPTVQYAIGFVEVENSWWKNPLYYSDLEVDSPYNSYIYAGLLPGPICTPGINSLEAAAFPETTTYLYFQAACDGSGYHNFAETYQEHVNNICQ